MISSKKLFKRKMRVCWIKFCSNLNPQEPLKRFGIKSKLSTKDHWMGSVFDAGKVMNAFIDKLQILPHKAPSSALTHVSRPFLSHAPHKLLKIYYVPHMQHVHNSKCSKFQNCSLSSLNDGRVTKLLNKYNNLNKHNIVRYSSTK